MQYQHILNTLNTAISKNDCVRETLLQILRDQDEYLEPLTILQQLTFS